MLKKAQNEYDFYETPKHHATKIYNDYNPRETLKIIDICCGLGSLVQPWYDAGHDITLVEFNVEFIPLLEKKFPNALIINNDFFKSDINEHYDVYLCNPPFNTDNEKKIYVSFFCKILTMMKDFSTFYFICPKMFYKDQNEIRIEANNLSTYSIIEHLKTHNKMPAYFYFEKFNVIELHSDGFTFNKQMIKRMKASSIIPDDFIDEADNMINPYFEFRYLGNVFDFAETNCKCGLFKVNK